MSKKIEDQTKDAMEYIDRLFYEISYLIKEIEGQLLKHNFFIGQVNGYQVTSRTSSGLDSTYIQYWMPKTFTVFFNEKKNHEKRGGQTFTKFKRMLKLPLIHIDLSNSISKRPMLYFGVIYNILPKGKGWSKWEHAMTKFSYEYNSIFENPSNVNFSDNYISFKGEFKSIPLFTINDSQHIDSKIINPLVNMYSKNR